jgi:hypothetical protein
VKGGDNHLDQICFIRARKSNSRSREHTLHTPISGRAREGRSMEEEHAMRARAHIDLDSALGTSCSQRWVAGGIALIVFMTFWSAWVLVIGFRPYPLTYLWWR